MTPQQVIDLEAIVVNCTDCGELFHDMREFVTKILPTPSIYPNDYINEGLEKIIEEDLDNADATTNNMKHFVENLVNPSKLIDLVDENDFEKLADLYHKMRICEDYIAEYPINSQVPRYFYNVSCSIISLKMQLEQMILLRDYLDEFESYLPSEILGRDDCEKNMKFYERILHEGEGESYMENKA